MDYAQLLQIGISVYGEMAANGQRGQAEQLRQEAMKKYGLALPKLEQLQAMYQQKSALGDVKANEDYTSAQNEALHGLQGEAFGSGLSDQDMASLEQARQNAAGFERGSLDRNRQEQAARGQLNSGFDIAQQMAASQGGADRAYQGAVQTAGQAASRKLQAMNLYGGYAKAIRDADLGQKNLAASAQDRINQFNTAEDRRVQDWNTNGIQQQNYENVGTMNGAERTRAGDYDKSADRTQQTFADYGEGVGRMGDAYYDQEQRKKKGYGGGSDYMSLAALMGDK